MMINFKHYNHQLLKRKILPPVMETITVLALSLITPMVVLLSVYFTSLRPKPQKGTKGEAPLPPGRTGWPIIGETVEFVRSSMSGNPEQFTLDRMNKFSAEVFRTKLMDQNVAVFSGALGNKYFFTTAGKYMPNRWLPDSIAKLIVSPENAEMARSQYSIEGRKMTNEFLRPEFLQHTLLGVVDKFAKQHVDKYCSSEKQVTVLELAKCYTFSLNSYVLLSLDDPEKIQLLQHLFEDTFKGLGSIPLNIPGTTFYHALKAYRDFREEIMSIVVQRKANALSKKPESKDFKDVLSILFTLQFGQDAHEFPSDTIIFDMIIGFFLAAHDTTSSTITCIVKYLAELPDVYAQVLQEQTEIAKCKKPGELLNWEDIQKMKYTWCVAQESLRLSPPSQGSFRDVDQDFSFAGFTIPKGWKAYWTVHSTHRNPKYFANPDAFDPSRFQNGAPPPFTYVPFGGGTHICPGKEYARIKILAFLHNFVTQYHFEKILPNEKMSYRLAGFPASGLPVRIYPRKMI